VVPDGRFVTFVRGDAHWRANPDTGGVVARFDPSTAAPLR
jgi:hypothetical protein